MTTISIRVGDELRKKMRKFEGVNWSDYLREAIIQRIKEEEIRRACSTMDEIALKTSGKWSGTKEIRKWRDSRYGAKSK